MADPIGRPKGESWRHLKRTRMGYSVRSCGICGGKIRPSDACYRNTRRQAHAECVERGCLTCGNPCDPHRKPRHCYVCAPGHVVGTLEEQ